MALLGRSGSQKRKHASTTVISGETHFVGEISLNDNLHIDGSIKGHVKSAADVTIGKTGFIEGELSAVNVIVSGRFIGNVSAQRVEIVSGGRVDGEVEVAELVIESGGHFNGSSKTRQEETARRISYDNFAESGQKENEEVVDFELGEASKAAVQNTKTA